MAEHRDIHQQVTERILDALKRGAAPWQRPWQDGAGFDLPVNAVTGRPYHGINTLLLWGEGDPRWCTYKQAQEQGWQVREGKTGTQICFYKPVEVADKEKINPDTGEPEKRTIPMLRAYTVFNAQQIEGIPPLDREALRPPGWDPHAAAEGVIARSGADIRHGGNAAFYVPKEDTIHLPELAQFPSAGDYYGTALHELGHWTGHESRLDRRFGRFGDETYAKEELRAEIASAMLSAELGVPHDPETHASYVGSWIETLRNDKREIFRAAADAQKIADFLMGREIAREQHAEHELERSSAAVDRAGGHAGVQGEAMNTELKALAEQTGAGTSQLARGQDGDRYSGRILAASTHFIAQDVGKDLVTYHRKDHLAHVPGVGKVVTIHYGAGRGLVEERGRTPSLQR